MSDKHPWDDITPDSGSGTDRIPKVSGSAGDWETIEAADLAALLDHDALVNFDADEHRDWTADQGAANIHVNNITAVPEGAVTAHEGALDHDGLANTHNLTTDIDHDALTNFASDEHVPHSTIDINAGTGLTGGGTIAADRTLNVDVGIADDKIVQVDGSPNAGEFARFTANGLEGRTESEFKGDFNLEIGTDVLAQQTIGISNDNLVEVDGSPASGELAIWTANGLDGLEVAGTSFPGSPATGRRYFRTDLGLEFFYNGTYWLTVQEFIVNGEYTIFSSNGDEYIVLRWDYPLFITRVSMSVQPYGTNDGSNYWSIISRSRSWDYGSSTTLTTVTTAADTVDVYVDKSYDENSAPANYGIIDFRCEKTGSPGNMRLWPSVAFRLIGT